MKRSDASFILFMHTGIDYWQKKMVHYIFLEKACMILCLHWLFLFTITGLVQIVLLFMPFVVVTYIVNAITVVAYIILLILTIRYCTKWQKVIDELIARYGEFPDELEQMIIDNCNNLVGGGKLPIEYHEVEQKYLDKIISKAR
ncbi:MAG: hypothetical protein IIY81_10555 [Lachnospiraceae bacterium]|nr:hypothetical protein [Lachnospiraceae bacterium]